MCTHVWIVIRVKSIVDGTLNLYISKCNKYTSHAKVAQINHNFICLGLENTLPISGYAYSTVKVTVMCQWQVSVLNSRPGDTNLQSVSLKAHCRNYWIRKNYSTQNQSADFTSHSRRVEKSVHLICAKRNFLFIRYGRKADHDVGHRSPYYPNKLIPCPLCGGERATVYLRRWGCIGTWVNSAMSIISNGQASSSIALAYNAMSDWKTKTTPPASAWFDEVGYESTCCFGNELQNR